MSVSAVATPSYSDPERLVPFLPSERADTAAAARERDQHLSMFAEGDDSPSFWDVLDIVNPLQHIPVVNKIYQELTGDKIGVGARVVGGALFGGPVGLIASALDCALEEETGKDAGGHLLALFDDDAAAPPDAAVAEAKPAGAAAESARPAIPAAAAITLPDVPVRPAASAPMMFTSDGSLAAPAAAAPPAVSETAARPLALATAPARFMPAPARGTAASPVNAPQVTVPVSTSGIRSHVPITGRDPAPSAMAVQKAMAAQGLGGIEHPMLPPAAAPQSAPPGPQAGANADWFSAMSKALDKYERANSLAARPSPTQVTVQ